MPTTAEPRNHIRAALLVGCCSALLASGCATIANGRYQRIQVETNPPAAKVSVNGTHHSARTKPLRFETPGEVILLRREKQVTLMIEKDGFEPAEVALKRGASGWAFVGGTSFLGLGIFSGGVEGGAVGGLVFGAIYLGISVGIDLATGSAYRLDPSKVSLTLQPEADSSGAQSLQHELPPRSLPPP